MRRVVVLGEALIDLFAEAGASLRTAKALQPSPGGAPANVAVALGKLGAEVGFIGKVGDDELGHWLREVMAGYGVDVTHTTLDSRAPTMLAVVALPSADNPQFVLYNGANELLTPNDIPQAYLSEAAVFVFGSVTLSTTSADAALHAAQVAQKAGAAVIFDVNLRPNLWNNLATARAKIEAAVAASTIVKANEDEIEFLTGTTDVEAGSQRVVEGGAALCCVTLGARGAFFRTANASGHVPSFALETVDATGSGDAFVAGLAWQVAQLEQPLSSLSADDLTAMVRFANACGALTTTVVGGMVGSPTLDTVRELLEQNT